VSTYGVTLIGLRVQARFFGLDPNLEVVSNFLRHTADVMAQGQDREQKLINIIHKRDFGDDHENSI